MIINSREFLFSDLFKVYNVFDEFGCMFLCSNKEGCLKGVYDYDKRLCFFEMDGCKKWKENNFGEVLLLIGKKFVLFNKVFERFKWVLDCF